MSSSLNINGNPFPRLFAASPRNPAPWLEGYIVHCTIKGKNFVRRTSYGEKPPEKTDKSRRLPQRLFNFLATLETYPDSRTCSASRGQAKLFANNALARIAA